MIDQQSAAEALKDVKDLQQKVQRDNRRDLGLGIVVGLGVGVQSFPWAQGSLPLIFILIAVVTTISVARRGVKLRNRTGETLVTGAACAGLAVLAMALGREWGQPWAGPLLGLLAFGICSAGSRAFLR